MYRAYIFVFVIAIFQFSLQVDVKSQTIEKDLLKLGEKIYAPTPQPEKYFDDLIHPCVRFIQQGFAGSKWWMIASPYYGFNSKIENPILYRGESLNDSVPPITWIATAIVEETPKMGYNSDPTIFFKDDSLWIFWRENFTPTCVEHNIKRGTFGCYTLDGFSFSKKQLFAGEKSDTLDHEMCPILVSIQDSIRMFGCFHSFPAKNRKPLGLAIWNLNNNSFENMFEMSFIVNPKYKTGFDFWHFDIFNYQGIYYCVATSEAADEIILGRSFDGFNFTFWNKPLLSSKNTGRRYFYKPSAIVLNGIFYLWYPVAEINSNPQTNRIWMSKMNFGNLINTLDNKKVDSLESKPFFKNIVTSVGDKISINSSEKIRLEIFTLKGQQVYSNSTFVGEMQLSLSPGIYLVKINSEIIKIFL